MPTLLQNLTVHSKNVPVDRKRVRTGSPEENDATLLTSMPEDAETPSEEAFNTSNVIDSDNEESATRSESLDARTQPLCSNKRQKRGASNDQRERGHDATQKGPRGWIRPPSTTTGTNSQLVGRL